MSQDQKFFDIFSLVLGILVVVAFGIYALSARIGNATQGQYLQADSTYQEQVVAAIQPVGQVLMPGEDASLAGAVVDTAEPVKTVLTGPQVYNEACIACHGAGIGGAPMYGNADAWAPRIAKGIDTLYTHSINGFAGDAGYMPAKGGRTDLSDDEIRAAVDHMIESSQ
ncbi:MAG: c-type cytochrome [Pseudomonadota bacterium]